MKLSDIQKNRVIPTEVDGVYIRDLPMAEFETLFKDAEERLNGEDKSFIVELFRDVICDEKGEVFEDLVDADYDYIVSALSANLMFDIIYSIPKAVLPKGADLGNLKEIGEGK